MLYNDFKETKLSMLGMGCMRFPCDENDEVDMEKTAQMVDFCIKNGVNYFDSAWFYHKEKSEEIMGKILSKYDRKSFNFATKMPWSGIETNQKVKEVFETQLKRTGFDYFDFYLCHNVNDSNITTFTDDEIGVMEFLKEQKNKGKIRHIGFSTHGSLETIEKFIVKYKDIVEFCQIQLNWLDWTLQDAKAKVELLNKYNIPIWVMEPVRGGKLASLSSEDEKELKALRPDENVPAWAFRFLQSIDNIKMILSGMSDMTQVKENIKTFSQNKPLNEVEKETILGIADKILSKKTLACTYCKYCMESCPSKLEIPKLLSLYNDMCMIKDSPSLEGVKEKTEILPSECVGCRACEEKCPQNIKISEIMADFTERLGL